MAVYPMTMGRRALLAGGLVAGLHGRAFSGLGGAGPPSLSHSIPSVATRGAPGSSRWRPSAQTRIVTDDAFHPEARRLGRDLVALGLLRSPPRITARGATERDIVLAHRAVGSDEGYRLSLSERGPLRLEAQTRAGLYYATRTMLQTLVATGGIPSGEILDQPDRRQRGVTVDVGRKFYDPTWLKRLIAEMGWLKLNMLHLHLTDNEGFGYASARYPQLASPRHLSLRDLREIVAFAATHHVTVVPELDSPGHLGSVLKHFPQFTLRTATGATKSRAIDVSLPGARALVDSLIDEILPIFPGPYWHLGGDEVLLTELPDAPTELLDQSYPQLVAYARSRIGEGATAHDAITLYLNDLNARLSERGKESRAWNDGMQSAGAVRIDPTITVDYWENLGGKLKTADQHLAEGHQLLNAHSRFLYYVVAEPPFPWYPRPTLERIYTGWKVDRFEGWEAPVVAGPNLLGGHLAIWADRAEDRSAKQIADDIRGPLRALAQKTWRDDPPALTVAAFAELARAVGPAPAGPR